MALFSALAKTPPMMRRAGVIVLALLAFVALSYGALCYQYQLFPWSMRTVELNHGRFAFKLPARWDLTARHGNEYRFADRTLNSGVIVHVAFLPKPTSATMRRDLLETPAGEAKFKEIEAGRFYRTLTVVKKIDDDPITFKRHELLVFDPRGASWFMRADWLENPDMAYLPNVIADNHFFDAEIPRVRVELKENPQERDEWALGRIELVKADAQLNLSSTILTWTILAFFVAWAISYLIFERILHLSKIAYCWVGQAATLISALGIFFASFTFFSTKSDYRMQIAQVAADSEIDKALTFYQTMASDCRALSADGGWSIRMTPSPEIPESMGTAIECEKLAPYLQTLNSYLLDAHEHMLKNGDFVDPNYRLGLPIRSFMANIHSLPFRIRALSDEQRDVLSDRSDYFFAPLELVLREVQSQSDMIDTAETLTEVSKLWGIMLALALALNMVKLTADRRFERDKLLAKPANGDPIDPDDGGTSAIAAETAPPTNLPPEPPPDSIESAVATDTVHH